MHARTNTHTHASTCRPLLMEPHNSTHSLTHPHPPPPPHSLSSPSHSHLQHEPVLHTQHNLLPLSVISDEGVQYVRVGHPPNQLRVLDSGITEYQQILQRRNTLHNTTPSLHNTTPALHKITHSLHNTTNDAQPHFILGTGKGDHHTPVYWLVVEFSNSLSFPWLLEVSSTGLLVSRPQQNTYSARGLPHQNNQPLQELPCHRMDTLTLETASADDSTGHPEQ